MPKISYARIMALPDPLPEPQKGFGKMRNPHVIWASVVIVAMILASTVILILNGKDTGTILAIMASIAVPLLGAFGAAGWQVLQQVKTQGNGTLSKAMEQSAATNAEILRMFKAMHPQLQGMDQAGVPSIPDMSLQAYLNTQHDVTQQLPAQK